jgi:hypothetical protein
MFAPRTGGHETAQIAANTARSPMARAARNMQLTNADCLLRQPGGFESQVSLLLAACSNLLPKLLDRRAELIEQASGAVN